MPEDRPDEAQLLQGATTSIEELRLFLDLSPDLMCIAGFDGRLEHLNHAWTEDMGWTREELGVHLFWDLVHPDDRHSTRKEVRALATSGSTASFENRCRHRDGTYRRLKWQARSVPGDRRILATARDLTNQRRLEAEILEIADWEKERLGQELHDSLCQNLAGIAALSSTLSRNLTSNNDIDYAPAAREIASLIGDAIAETRNLARGLGPLDLGRAGFDGALESLVSGVRDRFEIDSSLELHPSVIEHASNKTQHHIFRIAQEALSNAVKHGQAKRIDVALVGAGPGAELRVLDDGVGLPENPAAHDGSGMQTMAYRSKLIEGSLGVRSRPGGGTEVVCSFPISAPLEDCT